MDTASRAVLGLEHSGMVIAAVVEWLKKENALRLVPCLVLEDGFDW